MIRLRSLADLLTSRVARSRAASMRDARTLAASPRRPRKPVVLSMPPARPDWVAPSALAVWIRVFLIVLALAALLAALARAESLPRTLHPLAQQTSDEVIHGDLAAIDAWQRKLKGLSGAPSDLWRDFAARAWLSTARAEYLDSDRTGYPQAAFVRAVELISDIERGMEPATYQSVPSAVPPHGSARVADSLYAAIEAMKRDFGFLCAAEELANMEIQLAWAGNEQVDQGDCHSSPHLAEATRLLPIARHKVETCQPPLLAERRAVEIPRPVIPKADTVVAPVVVIPTVEELKIPRNVHFGLNQFNIGPTSLSVIAGIAALLQKYPSITVRLEGHTDSRGNADYNLELSRRRVMAARDVFLEFGIDTTRITWTFKGKGELYAAEDSKRGFALNRRVEMVFVDSEGRDIKAERQETDIQIEADRPVRKPVRTVKPPGSPKPPAPGVKSGAVRRTTSVAPKSPGAVTPKPAAKPAARTTATKKPASSTP